MIILCFAATIDLSPPCARISLDPVTFPKALSVTPPSPSSPHPSERGQSLLELALALPVLFILLFAIINAATIIRSWQALQGAAFAGARAAALTRDPAYTTGFIVANLKSFGDPSDPGFPVFSVYSSASAGLTARNPHHPPPGPEGVYCHSVTVAALLEEATPGLAGDDVGRHLDQYRRSFQGECPNAFSGDHYVTVAIAYEARVAGPFFPQWTIPLRARATARIEDGP